MIETLKAHGFELDLAASRGGCVTRFCYKSKDILRPALPTFFSSNWDPLDSSGFPMVPFVGRISNGRFNHGKKTTQLPANMLPEPHAIHGFGWQSDWQIASSAAAQATLTQTYKPGSWPWAYKADQYFALTPNGLVLTLSLQNLGTTDMPAGLGWHPYFLKASASLSAPVTRSWTGRSDSHETAPLTPATDLRTARPITALALDTAFDLGKPEAYIGTMHFETTLISDPVFSKLTVFTPPEKDFFCVEPITHAPDAVNMSLPKTETGLVQLAPNETLSGKIELRVLNR